MRVPVDSLADSFCETDTPCCVFDSNSSVHVDGQDDYGEDSHPFADMVIGQSRVLYFSSDEERTFFPILVLVLSLRI